ncbi:MAG: NfeD family protein [Verrucomicrobiales bacterium]
MKRLLALLSLLLLAAASPAAEEAYTGKVVRITIGEKDLVNGQSFKFWERTLARIVDEKAKALVLDLDTPGGLAFATQELMSQVSGLDLPTYAYVNPKALSAGALTAVATDKIYMAPGSTIGAAAVVNSTGMEIEKHMRAKLESAFDAHVRGILDKKGHRHEVVKAMTVIDEEEARQIGPVTVEKGELLTLTAEEAASLMPDDKPLLAAGVVSSLGELLARENLTSAPLVTATPTGFERFAWWVAAYSGLLIMIGLGGGYLELKTPGFGVGGTVALIAFGLFFFGNYLAGGLAGYELAFLFILGLVLIALEIFVIPGLAITGMVGVLLVALSLIMAMTDSSQWDEAREFGSWKDLLTPLQGPVLSLILGFLGSLVILVLIIKYLPQIPFLNRYMLQDALPATTPADPLRAPTPSLIGATGTALTDLRPAGLAEISGRRLDVTLSGGFASKGTKLRVIEDSMRTLVEPLD